MSWSRRPWFVPACFFLFTWTLTTHGKYSVSGDEPHYLMVAESLITDGDLDLRNNYAQNDGRLFGHDGLVQGPHARLARTGAVESVHDIGLPVALVPAYATAKFFSRPMPDALLARMRMSRGLFAYSIVSLSLIALSAFGLSRLTIALIDATGDQRVAWLLLLVGISPPFVSHAFLVFPEVGALVVTCLVVWFSLRGSGRNESRVALTLLLLLGLLPWTHRKYSIYVFGLMFVMWWFKRAVFRAATMRQRTAGVVMFFLPHAAFHIWTFWHWGSLGGPQMLDGVPFTWDAFRRGLAGLWLDRQSGVLAYAPIYWLLVAAWLLTWRRTWPFLVPALLLYLPMASFVEWWAGFAPAGRYLVPVLPLAAVPMAFALRSQFFAVALVPFALFQVAIDAVVWQTPRTLWPSASGRNLALEGLGMIGSLYASMLPALRTTAASASTLSLPWVAVATAATTASRRTS